MTELKTGGAQGYLRIATEEAFITPELLDCYMRAARRAAIDDPGFNSLWGFYHRQPRRRAPPTSSNGCRTSARAASPTWTRAGIDRQIIALTAPGHAGASSATRPWPLARDSPTTSWPRPAAPSRPLHRHGRDRAAGPGRGRPRRSSARSTKLGFKAVIINCTPNGEYLDDPKFWPIFEAAEALGLPIYLHPTRPSTGMIGPLLEAGSTARSSASASRPGCTRCASSSRACSTAFQAADSSSATCGEALPFWMFRLDYMHAAGVTLRALRLHEAAARRPIIELPQARTSTSPTRAWPGSPRSSSPKSVIGDGPRHVCDGLSVPVRRRRSRGPGRA